MEAKEIEEGNRLIAEFMGWEIEPGMEKEDNPYYNHGFCMVLLSEMQYHTSWDWLKPVIDKIFTYALAHREQVDKIINISIVVDILPAWQAVVDFIKWYNQKQKQ